MLNAIRVSYGVNTFPVAYIPGANTNYVDVFEWADQAMYEDGRVYDVKHGNALR